MSVRTDKLSGYYAKVFIKGKIFIEMNYNLRLSFKI